MGLVERHAYRTGYLKSEHWQNLRIQKLAQVDARCHFCNHRDLSNDVHHVFYPRDLTSTRLHMLVVLCRKHHEEVHSWIKERDVKRPPDSTDAEALKFDRETFKRAATSIEDKMRASGEVCYTARGSRIQNNGHLKRILNDKFPKERPELPELESVISKLNHLAQTSDIKIDSAISALEAEVSRIKAENESQRKLYAAEYIKNETAGIEN